MKAVSRTEFNPANRGYHAVYREHQVNHCPGCGRTHWLIGRNSAECAFCATALPLDYSLAAPAETAVIAVNDNHQKVKDATFSLSAHHRPESNVTVIDTLRPMFDNAQRGYHAVYRENEVNHCPGCGRTHWHIGRMSAECGFCATTLPLDSALAAPADTALIVSHDNHRGAKGEGNRSEGNFAVQ